MEPIGNMADDCESELLFEEGAACCYCDCACNARQDKSYSSQMTQLKQMWDQWSELQQVLALYALLRQSSTHPSSAHLMIANMLYAQQSNDYLQDLLQQANDPVWVANMEIKCMEESNFYEYQDYETEELGERRGSSCSDRRDSSLTDRRDSSLTDRRDSSLTDRRDSSLTDRRDSSLTDRRDSSLTDRRDSSLTDRRDSSLTDRRDSSLTDRRDSSLTDRRDSSLTERRDSSLTERRDSSLTERRDSSLTERRDSSLTERRDSSLTERRDSSLTERRDSSLTDRRDSSLTDRRDSSLTDRRDSSLTDRRDSSLTDRRDSSLTDRRDSSLTDRRDSSLTERRDSSLTERRDSSLTERRDSSLTDRRDSSLTERRDSSLTERRDSSLTERRDSSLTERRDSSLTERRDSSLNDRRDSSLNDRRDSSLADKSDSTLADKSDSTLADRRDSSLADRRDSTLADRRESFHSDRRESFTSNVSDRRGSSVSTLSDKKEGERERVESCGSEDMDERCGETPFSESLNELLLHLPLLHFNNTEAKMVYLAVISKVVYIAIRINNKCQSDTFTVQQKVKQLVTYAMLHPCVTQSERKSLMACLHSLNDATGNNPEEQHQKWSDLEAPMVSADGSPRDDKAAHSNHPVSDIGAWLKSLRLHKYEWLVGNLSYNQLLNLDDDILESKGVTKGARHKLLLSIARLNQRESQLIAIEEDIMKNTPGSIESGLTQLKNIIVTPMPPSTGHEDEKAKHLPSVFIRVLSKLVSAVAVAVNNVCDTNKQTRVNTSLSVNLVWLLDKCLQHESFTEHHKRLYLWRNQLILPTNAQYRQRNRRWSHQFEQNPTSVMHQQLLQQQMQLQQQCQMPPYLYPPNSLPITMLDRRQVYRPPVSPLPPNMFSFLGFWGGHRSPQLVNVIGGNPANLLPPQPFTTKRSSLQETPSQLRAHVSLQRTRSAPSRPHHPTLSTRPVSPNLQTSSPPLPSLTPRRASHPETSNWCEGGKDERTAPVPSTEDDITNQLETLCLSVTQHALE